MWQKLRERFLKEVRKKDPKELGVLIGVTFLVVIMTLWITHRDATTGGSETELGMMVPKGFLIVPIQLSNENSLSALVVRNGIVDVFKPGQNSALIENLRILKLSAGDGPIFGALVPEKTAGELQQALANPKLTAALRTLQAGPTIYHIMARSKPLLMEIPVGGE